MTIKTEWNRDRLGRDMTTVIKSRGKLTVEEIQTALRDKGMEGYFVIIIKVGDTDDGYFYEEPKGDACDVYAINQDEVCPICAKTSTVQYWCHECGNKLEERE